MAELDSARKGLSVVQNQRDRLEQELRQVKGRMEEEANAYREKVADLEEELKVSLLLLQHEMGLFRWILHPNVKHFWNWGWKGQLNSCPSKTLWKAFLEFDLISNWKCHMWTCLSWGWGGMEFIWNSYYNSLYMFLEGIFEVCPSSRTSTTGLSENYVRIEKGGCCLILGIGRPS